MRVLIVNNMAPFVSGGAEAMAEHLKRNVALAGHEVEVLRIPFQWEPAMRIPSQMLMARAFELQNVDHVIALKFPAYLIPHARKTLWLVHQYRQAYDLYDAQQSNLPPGELGADIRRVIKNADDECFRDARRIFAISDVTQNGSSTTTASHRRCCARLSTIPRFSRVAAMRATSLRVEG